MPACVGGSTSEHVSRVCIGPLHHHHTVKTQLERLTREDRGIAGSPRSRVERTHSKSRPATVMKLFPTASWLLQGEQLCGGSAEVRHKVVAFLRRGRSPFSVARHLSRVSSSPTRPMRMLVLRIRANRRAGLDFSRAIALRELASAKNMPFAANPDVLTFAVCGMAGTAGR